MKTAILFVVALLLSALPAIDRSGSGHDPLKPCSAGEQCRITGTYRLLGTGEQKTYAIETITDLDNKQTR
jgi:hypothetical protein